MTHSALLATFAKSSPLATAGVALIGSWLIAASAWVEVPMWPVPMTAQTYAVLLVGAACGARLGAATVAAYLIQGALGLPVFAGGDAGFAHIAGPTGGYLVGFLFAAALVGWLVERGWGARLFTLIAAIALGHVVVLALGAMHLSVFVGVDAAIATGVAPFVLGSIVKTFAAAATLRCVEALLARK